MHAIIDSNFDPHAVIVQNPNKPAPGELFHTLGLMQVYYYGFDGKVHQGQIVVASKAMAEVDAFFRQAYEMHFPIERVVPVSAPQYRWNGNKVLRDNVSAGFDYRTILESKKMSLHSQGLAFDINPKQNPYIRYEGKKTNVTPKDSTWNPDKPGTLYEGHPLVKLMEGFGWEWGGNWTRESGRTDYMHFQKSFE